MLFHYFRALVILTVDNSHKYLMKYRVFSDIYDCYPQEKVSVLRYKQLFEEHHSCLWITLNFMLHSDLFGKKQKIYFLRFAQFTWKRSDRSPLVSGVLQRFPIPA